MRGCGPEEGWQSLVLEEAGAGTGIVTIRRCLRGCKIGPLIAEGAGAAWRLLQAAAAAMPAEVLIVDVPEGNATLAARLEAAGFTETFRTARMYRGPAPEADGSLQGGGHAGAGPEPQLALSSRRSPGQRRFRSRQRPSLARQVSPAGDEARQNIAEIMPLAKHQPDRKQHHQPSA